MTKIDIFSGFLGAGKTTLIKKLIKEAYAGEKVVLIENEFGEIGIDGGFLADAGIEITEMNSGCICCSLVGDFSKALVKVLEEYNPDRIIIEPSGVGKLSDVIRAARTAEEHGAVLNCFTTVADVNKCKMYMKNFGEFYNDQIANASCIVLSHTQTAKDEKIAECVKLLRQHNESAVIVTTPWDSLDGKDILEAMEHKDTLEDAVKALEEEHKHHHHHHHHDHDEECECHGHHHDHDEECECHGHHHDHDEECGCHGHHHDHDEECECHGHHHDHHDHNHGEECSCGCHGHDHHHHHADEVFTSFGEETTKKFTMEEIRSILDQFSESDDYGMILRAKGIVECQCGKWIHFDYIPGEADVRCGSAGVIGRLCVIGAGIDKEKIKELFGI
ncbi:MAG: GTP-binding protein [Clostridia bacterium]|nr:GTP-binding protein [Clostridia bacterium]